MASAADHHRIQCVVIGAGVVGLSVAKTLCEAGVGTLVVEKLSKIGMENSSRNSEVLHSGIYYGKNDLKTSFVVQSNKQKIMNYIKERNININYCGKLIISSNESEEKKLNQLYKNGLDNGVEYLTLLKKEQVLQKESEISCSAAIFSEKTAVFDSHGLMENYLIDVKENNGDLVTNCSVENINCIQTPDVDFFWIR